MAFPTEPPIDYAEELALLLHAALEPVMVDPKDTRAGLDYAELLDLLRETAHLIGPRPDHSKAQAPDPDPAPPTDEFAELACSRRTWAAMMLTPDVYVYESILRGRAVCARQLDAEALRRALRGEAFPDPSAYLQITGEMLDAVAEGGPFA